MIPKRRGWLCFAWIWVTVGSWLPQQSWAQANPLWYGAPETLCENAIPICNTVYDFPYGMKDEVWNRFFWHMNTSPGLLNSLFQIPLPTILSTSLTSAGIVSTYPVFFKFNVVNTGEFCFTMTQYDTTDCYEYYLFTPTNGLVSPCGYNQISVVNYAQNLIMLDLGSTFMPYYFCNGVMKLSNQPPANPGCPHKSCITVYPGVDYYFVIQKSQYTTAAPGTPLVSPLPNPNPPHLSILCSKPAHPFLNMEPDGFTIDFSESTALFADTPPALLMPDSLTLDCDSGRLYLRFSEPLDCSSVDLTDFALTGPSGPVPLTQAWARGCAWGGSHDREWYLSSATGFLPGNYTLTLADTLLDACGSPVALGSFPFHLQVDTLGPGLATDTLELMCGQSTLSLSLSEPVVCAPYDSSSFSLTGPGGAVALYPLSLCGPGATKFSHMVFQTGALLTQSGTYGLVLHDTLSDACGNMPDSDTLWFYLRVLPPDAGPDVALDVCIGATGIRFTDELSPIVPRWGVWLNPNGQVRSDSLQLPADTNGVYAYVLAAPGCLADTAQLTLTIQPDPYAGNDTTLLFCFDDPAYDTLFLMPLLGPGATPGGTWFAPFFGIAADTLVTDTLPLPLYLRYYTRPEYRGCRMDTAWVTVQPEFPATANLSFTYPTCPNSSDGTISFVPNGGGGPPYLMSVNFGPWVPLATLTNLAANVTYDIRVMGANGCISSSWTPVLPPPNLTPPFWGFNIGQPSCPGIQDGFIAPQSGYLTVQYALNGGAFRPITQPFTGLAGGTYLLTFTVPGTSCLLDTLITVPPAPALGFTPVVTPVNCFGTPSGALQWTVAPAYTANPSSITYYSLNGQPGSTQSSYTNLFAGNYTVEVTYGFSGCTDTFQLAVTGPNAFIAVPTLTHNTCFGGSSGSALIQASGGTAPYEYALGNGAFSSNPLLGGLAAGTYTARIRDANSCIIAITFTITQRPQIVAGFGLFRPVCFGGTNGRIAVSTLPGTGPCTFSLDGVNFQTSNQFPGLTSGPYTVHVQDSFGCVRAFPVTLPSNQPIVASLNVMNLAYSGFGVSCAGSSNGQANVLTVNGQPPLTILWNGVAGGNVVNNLQAGTVVVTVVDVNGCTGADTGFVTAPPPVSVTATAATPYSGFGVTCPGVANGTVSASATGGAGAFSWQWNFNNALSASTLTGASAGIHTIVATDANGCRDTATAVVTAPPPLTVGISPQTPYNGAQISCAGASDGSLQAIATGGAGTYQYQWATVPVQSTVLATGLPAGSHSVTATDANGCQATASASLVAPLPVTATLSVTSNYNGFDLSCPGATDGAALAVAGGGTGPYTYLWSSGQASGQALALASGAHTVAVTDANGCANTFNITLSDPPAVSIDSVAMDPVVCFGQSNGQIQGIMASGGAGPYLWAWAGGPFGAGNTFTGLAATTDTLSVSDANGCIRKQEVTVTQPQPVAALVDSMAEVDCFGNKNGRIYPAATGGTGPFLFTLAGAPLLSLAWFDSLWTGNYPLIATDANGCADTVTASVTGPMALMVAVADSLPARCAGEASGAVLLSATGGVGGYAYGADTAVFFLSPWVGGLPSGPHVVYLRDGNGCVVGAPALVTEPTPVNLSLGQAVAVRCYGQNNGSLTLGASGGVGGYEFSMDSVVFQANPLFGGLAAATYPVWVRDSNGCTVSGEFSLTQPDSLAAAAIVTTDYNGFGVRCFGGNDGQATCSATGGTGPYQYVWSNGFVGLPATALTAGTYRLTVTDAQGCLAEDSVRLFAPDSLALSVAVVSDYTGWAVRCFGENNGEALALATGGVGGYAFLWSNGDLTARAAALPAGSYSAQVTDANGCQQVATLTLLEPPLLEAALDLSPVSCAGATDGRLTVQVAGGTPGYRGVWQTSPPRQGLTLEALGAGFYFVTVTDTNGCAATADARLEAPQALALTARTREAFCDAANGDLTALVQGGTGPYRYLWATQPPQTGQTATGLPEGAYQVKVTDARGCTDSLSVWLPGVPPPVAAFEVREPAGTGPVLLSEAEFAFQNQSVGALVWEWDFGDGTGRVGDQHPAYRYTEPGVYTVQLIVVHQYPDCPDTALQVVEVIPDGAMYQANAFTPNGDGINDSWFPLGEGLTRMELRIFDRWGREIVASSDPAYAWDGRLANGASAPEGVYTFTLRATLFDRSIVDRMGTITLLR